MSPGIELYPSGAGMLLAAAAVVLGAPLFGAGLRALRLRRHFSALRHPPLTEAPTGFIHLSGTVVPESPMFAPLSGSPCAGFGLEVNVVGSPITRRLSEHRRFRLSGGGVSASVHELGARWDLTVTAEREIAPDQALSERLSSLLERMPDAMLARRRGRALRLVERALMIGSECHVVGQARHTKPVELVAEMETELQRTGTDDAPQAAGVSPTHPMVTTRSEPELWVGGGEQLDFLLVSDRAPEPARLAPPAYRALGIALGPALSLAGLIYLASALEAMRALARL